MMEFFFRARQFAQSTLETQRAEFRSWGVMADWERPYKTMDPEFVKRELRLFYQLVKEGKMFRLILSF